MPRVEKWVKEHRTQLSLVLGLGFLVFAHPTPGTLIAGSIPVILGEWLRIWSSGHIHKNRELTVTGPYSLSRNPLYVGSFILSTGFVIAMGVLWLAIVFFLFFVCVYWLTIRWEEDKLRILFPGEWKEYADRVPRFLPVMRIPRFRAGQFSWAQVFKYREPANASVVLLVYLLLWGKAVFLGG